MPRIAGWSPSLRQLIWLIAVGPTLVAGGVVLLLSERAAERIAADLAGRYVEEAQGRVRQQVRDYLGGAVIASDLTARRIGPGGFDPDDLAGWLAPSLEQIESIPDIASITFGTPDGRAFWVVRTPAGYECALKVDARSETIEEFGVEPRGGALGERLRSSPFDPRVRPWYKAATDADGPVWSSIYTWVGAEHGAYTVGAAYVRTVRDADGNLIGVLSIDVTLGALSDFLAKAPIAETGTLLLIDADGRVVAASHAPVLGEDGDRLGFDAALATLDASVAFGGDGTSGGRLRGAPARYAVAGLGGVGLGGLRLVVAVPEAELFAGADRTRRRLLLAGVVVIALTAGLSYVVTSGLSRRLNAVRDHVRSVSEGRFESRLDERGPREWRVLAADLNAMAHDLETYLETRKGLEVAMEVQQALLPESAPSQKGLEVAGHSRYCDATGGDYYDFLEVSRAGTSGDLVAVGDVMGHGIAAALLMATARAALRAHASSSGSLGWLMTRVNDVLAADARHGRFMTLALMVFEPERRAVRWASAGHDPAIIIDPESGEAIELDEGDVPLGIAPGVEYEEYVRENVPRGALVLVGTDGIWEMASESGEMYGKDRLFKILAEHRRESVDAVVKAIDRDLAAFRGDARVNDDVTFVVARFA